MNHLEQKIEAVLFYKNGPVKIKELSKILEQDESDIREALSLLSKSLSNRGVCLVLSNDEATLSTSKETTELIEKIAKEEMRKDIGKAGLETLAIILYNNGASRREIDYIRGVNSTFILRNLCIRGLIEKEQDKKDQRSFVYKATLYLFAHLGIKTVDELPQIAEFKSKMEEVKNSLDSDE